VSKADRSARGRSTPPGGVTVELELSAKRQAQDARVLRWYAAALGYPRGWWFCASPSLARTVGDLVERERMGDVVAVVVLPADGAERGRG
jgi:hypothetical protein